MEGRAAGASLALPYCGAPPVPGALAWNLDPVLISVLGAGLLAGLGVAARRGRFLAGWAVLAVALLSPLCALAVALFSGRTAQHLLVLLGAAPLLAAGLGAAGRLATAPAQAMAAAGFAAVLWFWHLPVPYALTFTSSLGWWAMHASLLGAGLWLARGLVSGAAHRPEVALMVGLATAAQMGALGAFLTFAPRPLYWPHAVSTLPWGLHPIEDQQLGGLIMWIPGGVAFAALALAALAHALREPRPAA